MGSGPFVIAVPAFDTRALLISRAGVASHFKDLIDVREAAGGRACGTCAHGARLSARDARPAASNSDHAAAPMRTLDAEASCACCIRTCHFPYAWSV